jgi:hypothetical protein
MDLFDQPPALAKAARFCERAAEMAKFALPLPSPAFLFHLQGGHVFGLLVGYLSM